jgi:hypothetical protein
MKYIFLFTGLFLSISLSAQQELGLHFMQDNWYARTTNPAFDSPNKLIVGLPGIYNNLLITNLVYNDLVVERDGKRVLDIDAGIEKLGTNNKIRENLSVETIQLGFKVNKVLISLGHSVRFNAYLNYPKTLPQLIWQGNAQFIGQDVDFSTDTQLFGYNEFSLGLTVPVLSNFYIGGRIKYLSGFGDISTERSNLSLYTDDDAYALRLRSDLVVNSVGDISYNGFQDLQVNYNFGQFEGSDLFTKNRGYAFDLGAHLKLGKLDVAASILYVGQINWKSNVRNYNLNGDYEFEGLDLADEILEDASSLGSIIDTLIETYEVQETNLSYTTDLGYKTYVSAHYQFNEAVRLGVLFYGEQYREEFFPAVAIGGTARLTNWFTAGAHYAIRNETYDNIGLNLQFNVGPIHLLAATDNLLTAFRIKDSNSANVRVGLYFAFGESAPVKSKDNPDSWF